MALMFTEQEIAFARDVAKHGLDDLGPVELTTRTLRALAVLKDHRGELTTADVDSLFAIVYAPVALREESPDAQG